MPVAPAAHYLMGGIATDLEGATSIAGLYAAGESACTGAHGANRLASNSLLECFVFAHRAVAAGLDAAPPVVADGPPPERPLARAPLAELRRRMWDGAGPVRDREELERLAAWLDGRPESNPVRVASLIAASALERRESRGVAPAPRLSRPRPGPGGGRAMQSDVIGDVIGRALAEDLGTGDVTTDAVVPAALD